MLQILSNGIKKTQNLNVFIQEELNTYNDIDKIEAYAGWGYKATASKVRELAKKNNLPYIALEDGFIRSFDLGVNNAIPMSLSVDHFGCYYDCNQESFIEILLKDRTWFDKDLEQRCINLINLIKEYEISKYNKALPCNKDILFKEKSGSDRLKLLIIDQTFNDASLILGGADDKVSLSMCSLLKEKYINYDIYIKTHPDVISGAKKGALDLNFFKNSGIKFNLIDTNYNAIALLKSFDVVFSITSQMGFEALLLNKEVHCFAMSFYSGYGLTHDHFANSNLTRRNLIKNVTLQELFAAAYLKLCRYVNPITACRTNLEDILDLIYVQKTQFLKNYKDFVVINATSWKKELLEHYLQGYKSLHFIKNTNEAIEFCIKNGATLVQWASKKDESLDKIIKDNNISTLFVEDGFVRSKGLGSTYQKPFSLVLDKGGIYYDPSSNSDLFALLSNIKDYKYLFKLEQRASKLIDYLVKHSMTKYNIGTDSGFEKFKQDIKQQAQNKKIILAPGQVESDASVKKAGGLIQSNFEFLKKVREDNKDAFIIYKPHPDVIAQTRQADKNINEIKKYCDVIISDFNISLLYDLVDVICVLTSQSGFEAILRGKKVCVYGKPFYSNWGLSQDYQKIASRCAMLTKEQLVACVLILYPSYFDWCTNLFCRVEDICYRLEHDFVQPKDKFLVKFIKILLKIKNCFNKNQY